MATRAQIDARLTAAALAKIEVMQAKHLQDNGKCAQLRTDKGQTVVVSAIKSRGISDAELAAIERIDEYDGPRGKGFIVRLVAEESGTQYRKSVAFGPEAGDHTSDWQLALKLPM